MDDMFGGERYWQDGPDDDGDAEVAALWNGQLPMDRVLQTLQEEITKRAEWQARAAAAERRISELEAQLAKVDDEREDARHRAIINDVFGDDAKWGRDE